MELYFNPYPGAARSVEEGAKHAVEVADALLRLKQDLQNVRLSGAFADFDVPPSTFILVREALGEFRIRDIFFAAKAAEHDKLKLLLIVFSKGKVITAEDMLGIENWVVKNIGTTAPILEFAAKKNAIALSMPTEPEWRVDRIEFDGRHEFLHNLWGQNDLSQLKAHSIDSITNASERFSARYGAIVCEGALNSAPTGTHWESFGVFWNMDKAKDREYQADDYLIKKVGSTKYGALLELRCHSSGWRIFFVVSKDAIHKILIGGFYQKSGSASQNAAIQDASERINKRTAQIFCSVRYNKSKGHDLFAGYTPTLPGAG